MGMQILILTFFFEIKESKITRGHNFTLVKKQSRLDVRMFSFSQRTINVWNKLSEECLACFGKHLIEAVNVIFLVLLAVHGSDSSIQI